MDTEKQRQCRRDDARLTESGMLASRGTYRVAIQQRTAARRALEWIGASKARLVLNMKYQTCFPGYQSQAELALE